MLTGEEIKILNNIQNFRIRQSRKDKYEAKVSSVSSNEIRISAEKIRRTVGPIGGGGRIGGGLVETPSINAYEVLLTLDQAYKRSRCSVQSSTQKEYYCRALQLCLLEVMMEII